MPIYEYRRPDGSTFEVQQSFSDEPLSVDPDSGVPVERVLHAPAVHFKGKGFYNTDYGTRNRQRETAAAAAEKSSAEKAAEKSSSDKAAEKKPADGGSTSSTAGKGEKGSPAPAKSSDSKPLAAKG